ncbi:MAG: hypothetical protein K2X60_10340 [Xanthobacteraceae bacterium]|nr:hypothetical protein [Xanthobacteraceae bacterium]
MSESDSWPRPTYNVPPKDHLHAMSVVSINFNQFEAGLFSLFRHHLERREIPLPVLETIYGNIGGSDHGETIKQIFLYFETDPAVIGHVDHVLSYFQWCYESRNILMHSQQRGITLNDGEDIASFFKRSTKNYSKFNFTTFTVPQLRDIADAIHIGINYIVDLYFFLQVRDGRLPAWIPAVQTNALPDKPRIPKRIEVSDTHEARVGETRLPSASRL